MASYYENNFQEIGIVDNGRFSNVFKVRSIIDGEIYAIKKIPFVKKEEEQIKKEIKIFQSLNTKYVVSYNEIWIDRKSYFLTPHSGKLTQTKLSFKDENELTLYIKMKLYPFNLKHLIKNINFNTLKNSFKSKHFRTAFEIFYQLVECLNYLHSSKIIHRDIKPENILLFQGENYHFVKIADLGLSTFHEFVDQSHTKYVGTKKYRAPEVYHLNYDTKADIYSLGIVIQELFNFDINSEEDKNNKDIFQIEGLELMKRLCIECLETVSSKRPTCENILMQIKYLKSSFENVNYNFEIYQAISDEYFLKFEDLGQLGSGVFSSVFKAKSYVDNNLYAIKKIPIEEKYKIESLKEIVNLMSLSTIFVVKYYDFWIERNYYNIKPSSSVSPECYLLASDDKPLLMHVQMQLGLCSLDNFLQFFNSCKKNSISTVNYNIATEILRQLLECVNYLHNNDPPIIHRNLKPTNIILIKEKQNQCLKLCDFGLSVNYRFEEQSRNKYSGIKIYRAPEISLGQYDTSVDVYSVGLIIQELFCLNIDDDNLNVENEIREKYLYIIDVCLDSLDPKPQKRPSCEKILKEMNFWSFNSSINLIDCIKKIENSFNEEK